MKKNKNERIVEVILTAAFLGGILLAFCDLMNRPMIAIVAFVVGFFVLLLRQLVEKRQILKKRIEIGIYVASIGIFVLSVSFVVQGFLGLINHVITLWNLRFKTEFGRFATSSAAGMGSLILWSLLAIFFSWLLLSRIKKRKLGILIFLTIVSLGFQFLLAQESRVGTGSVVCFLIGILGSLLFFNAPKKGPGIRQFMIFGIFFIIVFLSALSCSRYEKIQKIEEWKKQAVDNFEKFRYGEDTLPKGNLAKASELLTGKKERLVLKTDTEEELYLKGFVGGSYKNSKWVPLSMEYYQKDYDGMLDWLEKQNFLPVTQYAKYEKITKESTNEAPDEVKVSVENTGAYRKYLYLPYSVSSWESDNDKVKKDWQVLSKNFFGASKYEFEMSSNAPNAQEALVPKWLEDPQNEEQNAYLSAEQVYHSFVENGYLEVNEDLSDVIMNFFFDGQIPSEESDFEEITVQIRQALRLKTSYNEFPEDVPEGKEFISWFLNDSQSGNAVFYASAAVLAYRMAGYPARYVEGYYLSDKEAKNLKEKNEIILTSKNAHAWVEVYRAGIGFMPIEVVPGMYVETYSNQRIEGKPAYQVQALEEQNGVKTEDETGVGGKASERPKESLKTEKIPSKRLGICILILYLGFLIYLVLEIQRWIRIKNRKKKGKSGNGYEIWYYVQEMERCFLTEKIQQNLNCPKQLWEEAKETFEDVDKTEYDLAIAILQKSVFGDKVLSAYEIQTLEAFLSKLQLSLYQRHSRPKKIWMRYFYCIDK